jgi:drug/metabolite transporter (DMT)-like permease
MHNKKNMEKKVEKAIVLTLMSATALALYTLFVKLGLSGLSVWAIVFLRFFFPLIIGIPYWWKNEIWKYLLRPRNFKLQLWRGALVAGSQLCFVFYLTKASLVNANTLWGLGPIFVPIVARMMYGQTISKVTWISIGISMLGVILILQPDRGIFDVYVIFGILSGLGMAFSQVLYGANVERGHIAENMFYLFFLGSLFTLPMFSVAEAIGEPLHFSITLTLIIAAMALMSFLNQYFRGLAYQISTPVLMTPFLYVSIFLSGIFDWVLFNNPPDFINLIGFCLIILGAFIKWRWLKRQMDLS